MAGFRLTAAAEDDLLAIWRYIAGDNPDAATRVIGDLYEKCAVLGENPKLGPARPGIAPELRYFPSVVDLKLLLLNAADVYSNFKSKTTLAVLTC